MKEMNHIYQARWMQFIVYQLVYDFCIFQNSTMENQTHTI